MNPDETRSLGMRIYHEVFEQGKLEVADELVAADSIESSPINIPGIPKTGPDSLKAFATMLRTAFPDVKVRVHELIVAGDTGVGRITFEGTHQGEFFGVPPTGRRVAWNAIDIVHIREGQVREHFGISDVFSLMQQLGVISAPGVPAE